MGLTIFLPHLLFVMFHDVMYEGVIQMFCLGQSSPQTIVFCTLMRFINTDTVYFTSLLKTKNYILLCIKRYIFRRQFETVSI